jgi:hypothetical protein
MKRIQIIKNNVVTNQADFETIEELNIWFEKEETNLSFGKPAYDEFIYEEENPLVILETIHHEAEYTFVIEDMADMIANREITKQIVELEALITTRRIREALISGDNSFIKNVDLEIDKLRGELI